MIRGNQAIFATHPYVLTQNAPAEFLGGRVDGDSFWAEGSRERNKHLRPEGALAGK